MDTLPNSTGNYCSSYDIPSVVVWISDVLKSKGQKEMSEKIPMKGGDEYDALTKARKFHLWKAGQVKKIKRAYNKRFRKQGKEIQDE